MISVSVLDCDLAEIVVQDDHNLDDKFIRGSKLCHPIYPKCTTINNNECKLPFIWKGISYHYCAIRPLNMISVPMCPTGINDDDDDTSPGFQNCADSCFVLERKKMQIAVFSPIQLPNPSITEFVAANWPRCYEQSRFWSGQALQKQHEFTHEHCALSCRGLAGCDSWHWKDNKDCFLFSGGYEDDYTYDDYTPNWNTQFRRGANGCWPSGGSNVKFLLHMIHDLQHTLLHKTVDLHRRHDVM